MKIILGSDFSFVLKFGYIATGISKEDMKIGYITTASKGARQFGRKVEEEIIPKIKENGYNLEVIDIVGKSSQEIKDFFEEKNVIHVEGGNTFYLLKAVKETGFAEILKNLLNNGKVYIGTSAGSYIMCPSIEVSDWGDDSIDRFNVTDFSALNYAPFVLRVHYKDDTKDFVRINMKKLHFPLRILRDGQGILIEDGKETFLGDGEEVKI